MVGDRQVLITAKTETFDSVATKPPRKVDRNRSLAEIEGGIKKGAAARYLWSLR